MNKIIMLVLLAASVVACETHGVIDSHYEGKDGSEWSLQQYNHQDRFYYSLSAWMPSRACGLGKVKVVAMGAGGQVKVRFERDPSVVSCEAT
jgi:hypothetical protein